MPLFWAIADEDSILRYPESHGEMPFHVLGFVEFAISHTFEIWIVGRKTLQPVNLSFLSGDQETRDSGGMTIRVLLYIPITWQIHIYIYKYTCTYKYTDTYRYTYTYTYIIYIYDPVGHQNHSWPSPIFWLVVSNFYHFWNDDPPLISLERPIQNEGFWVSTFCYSCCWPTKVDFS